MDFDSIGNDESSLNAQQRAAVDQIEGPLMILAGPGSGKTRVITHRIANMIAHDIPSYNIAALTFTNKAAEEMQKRLKVYAPDNQAWTGTFHRFCSRLLRNHARLVGLSENFSIFDAGDSKKVVKQAITNAKVDLRHFRRTDRQTRSAISKMLESQSTNFGPGRAMYWIRLPAKFTRNINACCGYPMVLILMICCCTLSTCCGSHPSCVNRWIGVMPT